MLTEYPQLPELTLSDGSLAAGRQTERWLENEVIPGRPAPAEIVEEDTEDAKEEKPSTPSPPPPDVFETALQAALSGRAQEGIEILMRGTLEKSSGRKRFEYKVQAAQFCMGLGLGEAALPLLREVASEIETRKLEEWEQPEIVMQPLKLLCQCLAETAGSEEELAQLQLRISRLEPAEI